MSVVVVVVVVVIVIVVVAMIVAVVWSTHRTQPRLHGPRTHLASESQ
jgi:hypothetical protein